MIICIGIFTRPRRMRLTDYTCALAFVPRSPPSLAANAAVVRSWLHDCSPFAQLLMMMGR